jgi:hypothetical protein
MEVKDFGFSDFWQNVPHYQSSDSSDAECEVHGYLHTNITHMLTRPQSKWHLVCFLLLCHFIPFSKWLTSCKQNTAFIISVTLIRSYLLILNFCIFNKNSTNTVTKCPLMYITHYLCLLFLLSAKSTMQGSTNPGCQVTTARSLHNVVTCNILEACSVH